MEGERYELNSFVDLLQLEDEQIERLLAELPSTLKKCKAMLEVINLCGGSLGDESPIVQLLSPLVWVDDGKRDITVNINVHPTNKV